MSVGWPGKRRKMIASWRFRCLAEEPVPLEKASSESSGYVLGDYKTLFRSHLFRQASILCN
eukprot:1151314-Pelagomonas_calceolata.AAC.2